jgi:hypothetical protein
MATISFKPRGEKEYQRIYVVLSNGRNNIFRRYVGYSIKKNDWTHEGESGTSIYKTIRFFKEADEFRNQISKEEVLQVDDKKEEEIDIEKINF